MGFNQRKTFFLMATLVACVFDCRSISASPVPAPARRAFDTSPAGVNNVNSNDAVEVHRLQDVDTTIKEVEALLHSDPSLPRLTRGEILDIIENLTRADVQKSFVRDPKAIMVVLPYSADSVKNGDYQTLYTKPPMTHIVEDDGSELENLDESRIKPEIPQKKRKPTKKPYQGNFESNQGVKIAKIPTTEASLAASSDIIEEQFQKQQEEVAQKVKTTTENPFTRFINKRRKTTRIPGNHKQEFEEVTVTSSTTTTTIAPETPKTTKRRRTTRKPSTTTSTTTTTTTTTAKPNEVIPNQGINIINPPSFQPIPKPMNTFQRMPTTSTTPRNIQRTTTTTTAPVSQTPMMVDEVQIPEDFKEVLKSLDILIKQSPTPTSLHENENENQKDINKDQLSEEDKLKMLFASLGAQTTTTTTTTSEPDVMQVANNLTPEMKDLLMTFGLIPDPNKEKTTTPKEEIFMEPSSVISPDSYTNFKPLPLGASTTNNQEMQDLLAKYGLVNKNNNNHREQKAISMTKPRNEIRNSKPNLDMIPDGFKDIISDIELPIKVNPLKDEIIKEVDESTTTKKPDHVFNPSNSGTEYATEDEINRLNQLMNVIKQFEMLNGTANEEDIKHIDLEGLKNLVNSFNVPLDQQQGPNPLDFDGGLLKNEVKRQTSTTTAKSVEPINPSLALLEDSFGGSSDSVSETLPIETTTTEAPKKTGFYYLLDWNSFFDIDNQKGKRVNLRFQPTVGDPKRFLSVTVP